MFGKVIQLLDSEIGKMLVRGLCGNENFYILTGCPKKKYPDLVYRSDKNIA